MRIVSYSGDQFDGQFAIRRLPVTYAWVERVHRPQYPEAKPVLVQYRTDALISSRIRIKKR
jgi:hypothetical protein